MTVKTLLDSIYYIPVLLEHLREPTHNSRIILTEANIDPEEFRPLQNLLEYHLKFIQGNGENYPLLRQGLKEYFDVYLKDIFKVIGETNQNVIMLDYGSGSGYYSDQFLSDNPDSVAIAVDKEHGQIKSRPNKYLLHIDFEKDPEWYNHYREYFHRVLLSELLHCKDLQGQKYLIGSALALLQPGGRLIINENVDYCMQYRISRLKGRQRTVVAPWDIEDLMRKFKVKQINHKTINNYHIYVYEKI
jgi:hypothetical protein